MEGEKRGERSGERERGRLGSEWVRERGRLIKRERERERERMRMSQKECFWDILSRVR